MVANVQFSTVAYSVKRMRPVLFGIFVIIATALVWFGYGARAAYFERYYAAVGMCVGLDELANRLSKDDLQFLSNATGCFFLERTSGEIWALDKTSGEQAVGHGVPLAVKPSTSGLFEFNERSTEQKLVSMFKPLLGAAWIEKL